jgi:uncharacterized protein YjbK
MGTDSRREFPAAKEHYTAVIEIIHSIPDQVLANDYKDAKIVPKQKRDVARIVVRADTIEKLTLKATQHLGLLEDE